MASLLSSWRSPKTDLDRGRSLHGVPVRSDNVTVAETAEDRDGLVLINRVVRGTKWWSRFAPPVLEQRLELDELGSFVFELIDGRHSVAQIIEKFVGKYRVNRREAELATVAFLRKLAQKRLIAIVIR